MRLIVTLSSAAALIVALLAGAPAEAADAPATDAGSTVGVTTFDGGCQDGYHLTFQQSVGLAAEAAGEATVTTCDETGDGEIATTGFVESSGSGTSGKSADVVGGRASFTGEDHLSVTRGATGTTESVPITLSYETCPPAGGVCTAHGSLHVDLTMRPVVPTLTASARMTSPGRTSLTATVAAQGFPDAVQPARRALNGSLTVTAADGTVLYTSRASNLNTTAFTTASFSPALTGVQAGDRLTVTYADDGALADASLAVVVVDGRRATAISVDGPFEVRDADHPAITGLVHGDLGNETSTWGSVNLGRVGVTETVDGKPWATSPLTDYHDTGEWASFQFDKPIPAGRHQLTVGRAGDGNFQPASATYTIDVTRGPLNVSALMIGSSSASSKTVTAGASVTLSLGLSDSLGKDPHTTVRFQRRAIGSSAWTTFATTTSAAMAGGAGGRASVKVTPTQHWQYRAYVPATSYRVGRTSDAVTVHLRPALTVTAKKHAKTVVLGVTVRPSVRVYLQVRSPKTSSYRTIASKPAKSGRVSFIVTRTDKNQHVRLYVRSAATHYSASKELTVARR